MTRRIFILALTLAGAYGRGPSLNHVDELIRAGRFVELRASAEDALRADAASADGWYAMGVAFLHGEGVVPRAYRCLTQARALLEAAGDRGELYQRTLQELIEAASLMDRYGEQVRLMELHDSQFDGIYGTDIGWPLMKMGRVEEARHRMLAVVSSGVDSAAGPAMNTLGAMEVEQDRLEAGYGWFERATALSSTTAVACNLAEATMGLGRYQEAERVLLAAAADSKRPISNPWTDLAQLFTLQGRLAEALSALDEMRAWTAQGPAWAADQRWAGQSRIAVQVMLATGQDDEALRLTGLLLGRPERNGRDSGNSDRSEASALVLRMEALRAARERLAEQTASATGWERMRLAWQRLSTAFDLWWVRRRAGRLLAARGIERSTIPFGVESPVPEWLRPPAGDTFGYNIEESAHRRREAILPERAYHRLALAEIALAHGRTTEALSGLDRAAAELPAEEVLLRARLDALAGRALELDGHLAAALDRYQRALRTSPREFRALGLALPVKVETDGSREAQQAAEMVLRSPRFARRSGFRLQIFTSSGTLRARLQTPEGALLAEAEGGDARTLCRDLHHATFTPRIDLAQTDSMSLDGSNGAIQLPDGGR